MAFYDKFPYTNFQELNLDWITQEVSKVRDNRDASDASAAAALASEKAAKASETAAASSQQAAANSETDAAASAAGIEAARQQIYTNTARINNILVEGTPTEGNAELIDIRVGANGVTYPTAGDAVRGQYSDLNQALSGLNVSGLNVGYEKVRNGTIFWKPILTANITGYYNSKNNTFSDGTGGFKYVVVSCSAGDIFKYSGIGGNLNNACTFRDANNNIIKKSGETADKTWSDAVFVAPEGTAQAIFNARMGSGWIQVFNAIWDANIDVWGNLLDALKITNDNYESDAYDYEKVDFVSVENKYYNWKPGASGEASANGFQYTNISCNQGDVFTYSGLCGQGFNACIFFDSNGDVLYASNENADTTYNEQKFVAPPTAASVIFNNKKTKVLSILKRKYIGFTSDIAENKQYSRLEITTVSNKYYSTASKRILDGTGFQYTVLPCKEGDQFVISTTCGNGWNAANVTGDSMSDLIWSSGETTDTWRVNYQFTVPSGGKFVYINNNSNTEHKMKVTKLIPTDKGSNPWRGKKIVWFGTSIPCGTESDNYPDIIASELGAIVYNEAVGASPARAGCAHNISENDPYGWNGAYYSNVAYGLAGSLAEKNDLITNYDSKWKAMLKGAPASLSATEQAKILSCSYENKVDKYLTGGSVGQVDLYVFDHGYNDNWFSNSSINEMNVIPSDENNRFYFLGAMNFLIRRILKDNPKAAICIIGHYEADWADTAVVTQAQQTLANYWRFPFFKTWEYLPFTEKTITTSGYWTMNGGIGTWTESGGPEQTITMKHLWLADNLHPYSDGSGKATKKYAETLMPFIRDYVH